MDRKNCQNCAYSHPPQIRGAGGVLLVCDNPKKHKAGGVLFVKLDSKCADWLNPPANEQAECVSIRGMSDKELSSFLAKVKQGKVEHKCCLMECGQLRQRVEAVEGLLTRVVAERDMLLQRLQVSPYGDDKIDELEESCDLLRHRAETAESELACVSAEKNARMYKAQHGEDGRDHGEDYFPWPTAEQAALPAINAKVLEDEIRALAEKHFAAGEIAVANGVLKTITRIHAAETIGSM